jgi:hypothetical protein
MIARIVALGLIILVSIVNPLYLNFISKTEWQIGLGTLIIAIIVFGDAITGLLLGVAFLVIYLRYYMKKFGVDLKGLLKKTLNPRDDSLVNKNEYITPQNLKDAQNNIVSDKDAEIEMKGIKGVYGEPVYGAQGIDKTMPGYDPLVYSPPI